MIRNVPKVEDSAVRHFEKITWVDLGMKHSFYGKGLDYLHGKLHPACQSAVTLIPRLHDTQKVRI